MTTVPPTAWLLRAATVFAAASAVASLTPAAAATTTTTDIHLNPGQQGKTAMDFQNSCDQVPGGRATGVDGWVFVLPGNRASLVSLDVTFRTGTGEVTIHIPDSGSPYPNGITRNGADKAYVVVPTSWRIADGSGRAENAKRDRFNVTHVCRGGGGVPESSPATSPSAAPSTSGAVSNGGNSNGSAGGIVSGGGALPVTGTATGGLLLLGVGLIAAGIGLVVLRRRRSAVEFEA